MRSFMLGMLFVLATATANQAVAQNYSYGYGQRHYYSPWSYNTNHNYYYRQYNYKPYSNYTGYRHHYCIHYTSQPRYVYYYNPVRAVYRGRFDLKAKEGAQYSLLAEKDRKKKLTDIPETAFPKPGAFPKIPDAELKDDLTVPAMKDGGPKDLNDLPEGLPKD